MMNADQLFQIANLLAMLGWMLLIVAPNWKWTNRLSVGVVITILSLLYVFFVFQALRPDDLSSFSTLDGVTALFANKQAVLVGWLHYLAFDLMTGVFILNSAKKHEIRHWWVVPCLLLSFMLGPTGLLLFLIIRAAKTRQYFQEYL